jgi:hypothetical protein
MAGSTVRPTPNKEPAVLMDPEKIFRTNYEFAESHAYGIERFAYKLIPYSILRSFCLTFDPREKWVAGLEQISPVTRNRTRTVASVLDKRSAFTRLRTNGATQVINSFTCVPTPGPLVTDTDHQSQIVVQPHPARTTVIRDTTRTTRPVGSNYGEFENFNFDIFSPDRTVTRRTSNFSESHVVGCDTFGYTKGETSAVGWTEGGAAILSRANVEAVRSAEVSTLTTLMAQRAPEMFAESLPSFRRYSLVRNLVELKDLPGSVLSARASLIDLKRLSELIPRKALTAIFAAKSARHVPQEYVSFWFGWRQTYNDILGLLSIPYPLSKEVNYLVERNGKATTLRSFKKFPGSVTTTPSFSYDPNNLSSDSLAESQVTVSTRHDRVHTMRLAINATFDFPSIGEPSFRTDFFLRKLGVVPTITDLYNLTPWTWLLDWFTGLGNYIEVIDTINTDPSLINFGFLTGITEGKVSTTHRSRTQNVIQRAYTPPFSSSTLTTDVWHTHTSVMEYKLQIRKNLRTVLNGVRSTAELSSLTTYQQSILGAILLSRRLS